MEHVCIQLMRSPQPKEALAIQTQPLVASHRMPLLCFQGKGTDLGLGHNGRGKLQGLWSLGVP